MGAGQGGPGLGLTYRIELRPAAVRALKAVDHKDRDRIRGAIALLGENPRPPGAKALQGRPGLRVRVGNYRIPYTIHDDVLIVVAVSLGQRGDLYKRWWATGAPYQSRLTFTRGRLCSKRHVSQRVVHDPQRSQNTAIEASWSRWLRKADRANGHSLRPTRWRNSGAVRYGTISLIESETSVRWIPGEARMTPAIR
jgi:mRNA interferase RelE/StbE